MTTKFKIITPAYNCADSIRQTIFSIAGQTYQNWEMVIINDVSTDDTVAAIEKLSESLNLTEKIIIKKHHTLTSRELNQG